MHLVLDKLTFFCLEFLEHFAVSVIFLELVTPGGNLFVLKMADCCKIFTKPEGEKTDLKKRTEHNNNYWKNLLKTTSSNSNKELEI